MAKRYFTDFEHPAVAEEHEDIYISDDDEDILRTANRITNIAARSRWQRFGFFLLDCVARSGGTVRRDELPSYAFDSAKHDEDDLNSDK